MKLQANDVVEVRGTVRWTEDELSDYVFLTIGGTSVSMKKSEVTLVHPGFEVGDAAVYQPTADKLYLSEIVAIHGGAAWLVGEYEGIVDLFELRRPEVEPDPTPAEAPPLAPIGDAGVILPATDEALTP